jgi:DSF synthase
MNAIVDIRHFSPAQRTQVETRFDPEYGVYWAFMNPKSRACITTELLGDLRSVVDTLTCDGGWIADEGQRHQVRYGVIASRTPHIFNLGGDLALFRDAIGSQDRNALMQYGERCIDVLLPWHQNCGVDVTTLSLVQGEALGGGFEGALSASVVVAEESSRMGFPEVLFNLFPGMGAYSFLSRKIGRRAAERIITSGTIYSARDLYDMGVVDVITPDGTGEAAVYSYIRKHAKQGNGRRAFERARGEVEPVTRDEMMRVLNVWVDAALRLQERDLRMMERLVRAQNRFNEADTGERATNVIPLQAVGAGD